MDRRAPSSNFRAQTSDKDYEEYLQKLNAQRRKSSVGGSSVKPNEEGVEWNPAEKEWSDDFIRKASEKIEKERRRSRGFESFKE